MEKITFKNSRNKTLVGNLSSLKSKLIIIILSHVLVNDKFKRGKLDVVVDKLNNSGFNTLVFDFSGCGESNNNNTLTVEKEVDDLKLAIKFVKTKGFERIALFGHSLECFVSLNAHSYKIKTLVLWSLVTNRITYRWQDNLSKKQFQELNKKRYFTRIRKNAIENI